MKKSKVFGIALLATAMLFGFVACKHNDESYTMSSEDQAAYDAQIIALAIGASMTEMSSANVKSMLDNANTVLESENKPFRIKDKNPDTPIAKGTTAEELKKRFVAVKA